MFSGVIGTRLYSQDPPAQVDSNPPAQVDSSVADDEEDLPTEILRLSSLSEVSDFASIWEEHNVLTSNQGESERLVRNLWELARKQKFAIIFIDEIDSLARYGLFSVCWLFDHII